MAFRYYYADKVREMMPEYRGTDEELQRAIDNISLEYGAAIREMETKLGILSDDFEKKYSYMPIHHVHSRLKTMESIVEKALRYGIDDPINNLDQVRREIMDIAGVRVVCNYEEDLHTMSSILLDQEDVQLIRMRDYCSNPKESGYRSLHAVVALPVYLVNGKKIVPVEVQFRSIAMDAWATLEHALRYKNKGHLSDNVQMELRDCADILHSVDERMAKVRHEVFSNKNEYNNY